MFNEMQGVFFAGVALGAVVGMLSVAVHAWEQGFLAGVSWAKTGLDDNLIVDREVR